MAPGKKTRATYADLEALPVEQVGEIVEGLLYASPRPAAPHAVASSSLGGLLQAPFQFGRGGPGGWWILDEPELHLGGDVFVPDLAGWRRERLPTIGDVPYFTLAPDWVCEVLSPPTATLDRARKKPAYAREGISHLWLIDPLARTLEALELHEGKWLELGAWANDAKVSVAPFEAVPLELGLLWTSPTPRNGDRQPFEAKDRGEPGET